MTFWGRYLLSPFYRGNWSTETGTNLPRVTQLESGRACKQTQTVWLQSLGSQSLDDTASYVILCPSATPNASVHLHKRHLIRLTRFMWQTCQEKCISSLLRTNKLLQNTKHWFPHRFCGSGTWVQLSWALQLGVSIRVTAGTTVSPRVNGARICFPAHSVAGVSWTEGLSSLSRELLHGVAHTMAAGFIKGSMWERKRACQQDGSHRLLRNYY